MGKTCPHCGMESDDERVCSWCGKPLLEEAAPTEGRERPTQEAAGAEAASAKPQVGAGRARHTGAAADMMAAEAAKDQRAKWPYYLAVVASLALVILGWSAISLRGALQPPQEPEEWQSLSSENDYLRL
ncbi:MAG: zinc ribbon domain-containing protein, partial [Armatimonadetes bacterium]|nr:zinc ribbon domain-containing protein [Armatimonadota bacterium]